MIKNYFVWCVCVVVAAVASIQGQSLSKPVKQPREVVEAYRVCNAFQRLIAQDLDFDRAFEATFTKDAQRRRQISIAESEFGDAGQASVDDATLVSIYKSHMQIFFLMLPLLSPANKEQEALFFPPEIKKIFDQKPPRTPEEFPAYAVLVKGYATDFRAHLNRLAAKYPFIAKRVREFKRDTLGKRLEPPAHVVQPLTAYSRGQVLRVDEEYYQVGDYAVIRENGEMRIIGIRTLARLF